MTATNICSNFGSHSQTVCREGLTDRPTHTYTTKMAESASHWQATSWHGNACLFAASQHLHVISSLGQGEAMRAEAA